MKELNTITEYQLLFLARQELSRRIDELKTKMIKSETGLLSRREDRLLTMYCEQLNEIVERMADTNGEEGETE